GDCVFMELKILRKWPRWRSRDGGVDRCHKGDSCVISLIAQPARFFHLRRQRLDAGNDAALFGERREGGMNGGKGAALDLVSAGAPTRGFLAVIPERWSTKIPGEVCWRNLGLVQAKSWEVRGCDRPSEVRGNDCD